MTNDYRGYSLFFDVENSVVRTWNRCSLYMNILQAHGSEQAGEYIKLVDDVGRQQMKRMFLEIREKGLEFVRKNVAQSIGG